MFVPLESCSGSFRLRDAVPTNESTRTARVGVRDDYVNTGRVLDMPTCERASVIPADFETVWRFYDGVDGLRRLTPAWMGARVRRVAGPDGQRDPEEYLVGTEIQLEIRPFNSTSLPAIEWVVEITDRVVGADRAYFVDEQVGDRGPFERWRHVHAFVDLGHRTLLYDRVTYRVPYVGSLPLATPGIAVLLWHRHRRTRALLAE